MNKRAKTAAVMTSAATLVAGAMAGALWVTAGMVGSAAPSTPDTVNVYPAAATAQPTATVTLAKAAARKVPAKKAPAKTTTKAKALVNNKAVSNAPADEPGDGATPPENGAGNNGATPLPLPTLPPLGP